MGVQRGAAASPPYPAPRRGCYVGPLLSKYRLNREVEADC